MATIILITRRYEIREYTEQVSHCPMPSAFPSCDQPLPDHLLNSKLSTTAHGIKYPVFLASLGHLSDLCTLLASSEN